MKLKTEHLVTEFSSDALFKILFENFGLSDQTKFVVAYSGGCDSQVLLHGLVCLRDQSNIDVIAAHFDHGLQHQSAAWAEQCQNWCDEFKVDFVSVREEIRIKPGDSIEAKAREARYRWLGEISTQGHVVVTAHHADDQAETFLLNLFQGREIEQLAGIARLRSLQFGSETKLLRPLLDFNKEQLVWYARKHRLEWIEDPLNFDHNFYRNYIRQQLIPIFRHRWPDVIASLNRGAIACRKIAERDRFVVKAMYLKCRSPDSRGIFCLTDPLDLNKLRDYDDFEITGLIRYWIHKSGYASPSKGQLATLYDQIIEQRAPRASLVFNDLVARFFNGHLYLTKPVQSQKSKIVSWDLRPKVIPELGIVVKFGTDSDTCQQRLALRSKTVQLAWREGGERIRLNNCEHHSSLKKVFQANFVTPWERDCLPYLKINDEIAWVYGIGGLGEFTANSNSPEFCLQFSQISD